MRLLLLLFLVGLALVSAIPAPSHDLSLDNADDLDYLISLGADDDIQTELGQKLRKKLDEVLEKLKESIETGKVLKEDYLEKIKELKEKMKELKVDLGEKGKELLEKIKEKAKEYWKKILDKFTFEKRSLVERDIREEIKKTLEEAYNKLMEFVKDQFENGKGVKDRYIEKLRDLRRKLKDATGDLDQKAREMLEKMTGDAKDMFRDFLTKLGIEKRAVEFHIEQAFAADDGTETDIGKELRKNLDEILEKIKDAVDQGKDLKETWMEKLKEIREKMKDMKVDLGNKAKELLEKVKDKMKDYWKRILEKIKPDQSFVEERSILDELNKVFEETYNRVMKFVKERFEKGQGVPDRYVKKLKELRDKLEGRLGDLDEKAKEMLEDMTGKARDNFQEFLTKLGIETPAAFVSKEKRSILEEMRKKLQETYNKMLDFVRGKFENGEEIRPRIMERIRDIREKLKDLTGNLDQKARDLLEKMTGKPKDLFRDFLRKLGIVQDTFVAHDDTKTELGKELQKHFDEILEKIKDAVDKGKDIKENLLEKLKEVREQMKDLKVEVGNRGKELLQKIKEKAKDYWNKILEKLRPSKRSLTDSNALFADDDDDTGEPTTELGKSLSKHLEEILKKIKDAIEHGKTVKSDYLEKARQLREKLKEMKESAGGRVRELWKKIKEEGKNWWEKLLENLGLGAPAVFRADDDDDGPKTELGKKLNKHLEELLEKIKDAIDHGKTVKETSLEKIKQIRDKLKEIHEDVGAHVKELWGKIKEGAKNWWKKWLEKMGFQKRAADMHVEAIFMEADDTADEVGQKLKEKIDNLLERISDFLEKGKVGKDEHIDKLVEKYKELREKLKQKKEDLSEKAKELVEKIKNKARELRDKVLKKLREIFGKEERSVEFQADDKIDEVGEKLKNKLNDLVEKLKDFFEKGKVAKDESIDKILEQLKDVRQKLKDKKIEIGEKIKEKFQKIREKFKDVLDKLLEKLGGKEKRKIDIREYLRDLKKRILDRFDADELKEKIEKFFGKKSEIAEQLINKLKEKGEKAKQRILDFIDRLLENKEEKRSIKELYEKIKNYLKDLKIELKEKFVKFGEWAKEKYEKGLERGKDAAENYKNLAKRFLKDLKETGKEIREDVRTQGLEFFENVKDIVGDVYEDIRKAVDDLKTKS